MPQESLSTLPPEEFKQAASDILQKPDSTKSQVTKLKHEITERAEKIPSHAEIMRTYEGAMSEDKLKIAKLLAKKAFESLNTTSLVGARRIEGEDKIDLGTGNRDGAPTVTYKQINHTVTTTTRSRFFRKRTTESVEKSDEVLVAINLNNSSNNNKEKRTVVVMIAKQNEGELDYKLQQGGAIHVMSQAKFEKIQNGESTTAVNMAMKGKLTYEGFKEEFKKEKDGVSLKEWHEKRILV